MAVKGIEVPGLLAGWSTHKPSDGSLTAGAAAHGAGDLLLSRSADGGQSERASERARGPTDVHGKSPGL